MRVLTIRETVWLNAEPEAVWRRLEALEDWPRWNHALARARWCGDSGWKEGHRFELSPRSGSLPWLGRGRVARVEPERELSFHARIFAPVARFLLRMESEGRGTQVTFEAQLSGLGARLASNGWIAGRLSGFLRSFVDYLREAGERVVGRIE